MATLPTRHSVTPLRQPRLNDIAIRPMPSRTQHDYARHVRGLHAPSPKRDYRRGTVLPASPARALCAEISYRRTVSALLFLFGVTLDLPGLSHKLVLAPRPRKLPDVLSVERC